MRVAIIPTPNLQSEWGSTLYGMLMAKRLASTGIDVHVYCQNHPSSAEAALQFKDLPLILSHPVLVDEGITDSEMLSFAHTLAEAIVADHSRTPFDIIHAHYATLTGLAGLFIQTVSGVPLVISSFGRDISVGASQDPRYQRMVALNLKQAQAVIASDAGIARDISHRFEVPSERVFVVPMPVDDKLFSSVEPQPALRRELLKDADYLIINISSCFNEEKGIKSLLHATRILNSDGLRLSLVIIGADDYADLRYERQLRQLCNELGLNGAVNFVGRIPHDQIPSYLASADLVVDPRTVDNFSSSLLEAMFAGAIGVAPDTAGNRLRFRPGQPCLFHCAGDPRDLAIKIRGALTDAELQNVVRSDLRRWRIEHGVQFTADYVRDSIVKIYDRVTAGN
jgi:glycosyltransferase involved in cell wall biosynthesis